MTKRSSLLTPSLLTLLGVVVFMWAVPVQAQPTTHPIHPFYSNQRAQIGNGLPIPITFAPAPLGRINPVPGATAMQGTTGSQPSIALAVTQFSAGIKTLNIGVWVSNNNVFQVQTSLTLKNPKFPATFSQGGRPGHQTVTWCPGLPVPGVSYNPSCAFPTPSADTRPLLLDSAFRYQSVLNQFGNLGQFGGSAQGAVAGVNLTQNGGPGRGAVVALKGGINPPCTAGSGMCIVVIDTVVPAPTGAAGGTFGFKNSTPGTPLVNPGLFFVTALGPSVAFPGALGGTLVKVGAALGPQPAGATNMATSWGGPLTTGMLTILAQNTANLGTEIFTLSGTDQINTVAGTRLISTVSGAVSQRNLSRPNANRGWQTMFLPEPGATLGALGALLALVGCHRLTRRR